MTAPSESSRKTNEKPPRLILLCSGRNLDVFREIARGASLLRDHYEVRVEVSGLSRKNFSILNDASDPYLEYKANTANLFNYSIPDEVAPFVDKAFVQDNLALMEKKIAILREFRLGAAFCGNDPMYMPEEFFHAHPEWRGPRVDHPWRSNKPYFAMCFHRPEVQDLYRRAVRSLTDKFPAIDTFWFRVNDSGSGFSWHPGLYFGANGSAETKGASMEQLHRAFHNAMLGGAKDAGVQHPVCVAAFSTDHSDYSTMPEGAFRQCKVREGKDGVSWIGSDIADTYPVRQIWDPLLFLEKLKDVRNQSPKVLVCWLNDVYYRTDMDAPSVRRMFTLWSKMEKRPDLLKSHASRMASLHQFANEEYDADVAEKVTDAWVNAHDVHRLQRYCIDGYPARYLLYYGCVSHRWLTRPLVPFPHELSPEEERHYLRYVWNPYGDASRRSRLLDYHSTHVAELNGHHAQRAEYLGLLISGYAKCAEDFRQAAALASGDQQTELEEKARAMRLMSCMWKTCANTIEFGLLLIKGVEGDPEGKNAPTWTFTEFGDATKVYRVALFEVLRREVDNVDAIRSLLKHNPSHILWLGTDATGEDTLTLGQDICEQLAIKRNTIIRHWQEVMRLQPASTALPAWQQ